MELFYLLCRDLNTKLDAGNWSRRKGGQKAASSQATEANNNNNNNVMATATSQEVASVSEGPLTIAWEEVDDVYIFPILKNLHFCLCAAGGYYLTSVYASLCLIQSLDKEKSMSGCLIPEAQEALKEWSCRRSREAQRQKESMQSQVGRPRVVIVVVQQQRR